MNTSAPLFAENNYKTEIEKQQAELYSRLYHLAAEDFVSHPDLKNYIEATKASIESLQNQITELMRIISNHTHIVPAHTHPILPHVHNSPESGAPTGPPVGGGLVTQPMQCVTQNPVEAGTIRWNKITFPRFNNTTGAPANMAGNMVAPGPSLVGPLVISKRRLKTPEILNTTVSIPPLLKIK